MTTRKPLTFANIPAWTLPSVPSALSFFESISLAGLEGQWIRLDAATQKALLGGVVFGKQEICVNDAGGVSVSRSVCFGQDSEDATYEISSIRAALEQKKLLSPGVSGARYL